MNYWKVTPGLNLSMNNHINSNDNKSFYLLTRRKPIYNPSVFYSNQKPMCVNKKSNANNNSFNSYKEIIAKSFVDKIKKEKQKLPKIFTINNKQQKAISTVYLKLNLSNLSYLRSQSTGRIRNVKRKKVPIENNRNNIILKCFKNDMIRESMTHSVSTKVMLR